MYLSNDWKPLNRMLIKTRDEPLFAYEATVLTLMTIIRGLNQVPDNESDSVAVSKF